MSILLRYNFPSILVYILDVKRFWVKSNTVCNQICQDVGEFLSWENGKFLQADGSGRFPGSGRLKEQPDVDSPK